MSPARTQCPDPHVLAALLDRGASVDADRAVIEHVASCAACRRLIGGLGRATDVALPQVSDALMAQAMTLGAPDTAAGGMRWWQAAGAAACVLVAVGLWRGTPWQQTDSPDGPVAGASATVDEVRGAGPAEPPQMLEPRPDAVIGAVPVVFRWTPVEGALQYRVQLLTSGGDIVWTGTTAETSMRFEGPAAVSGGQYYAWVAAQLPDGRRLQSTIVRLIGQTR